MQYAWVHMSELLENFSMSKAWIDLWFLTLHLRFCKIFEVEVHSPFERFISFISLNNLLSLIQLGLFCYFLIKQHAFLRKSWWSICSRHSNVSYNLQILFQVLLWLANIQLAVEVQLFVAMCAKNHLQIVHVHYPMKNWVGNFDSSHFFKHK